MAKAATDEQAELRRRARRRLIGAMALVTVVAVVLPWVLEGEPQQPEQEVSIQIPSRDAGPFNPKAPPSKQAGADKPPAVEAKPDASPDTPAAKADESLRAEQDKLLAPPAKAPAKDKPAPGAAEARGKATDKADAGKQFVVQVTALADADKASGIQKELAAKGLKAYTEMVKTASGDVTRVRVGPFPDRDAAEKERGRLKSLGFDGNVTPR